MKNKNYFALMAVCFALSIFSFGCKPTTDTAAKTADTTMQMPVEPDMVKIKADIQALENAWATADNARDATALAAFYADDAVSMMNNKPMIMGKAAIQKDIEVSMAKRVKGSMASYEILDVFGDENTVTEVGKTTIKDASGKVTYTGKYMAIWEKRDGKNVCVRDISNDDMKAK